MKRSPNICTKIENRATSRHARLKSQNNGEKAKMLQASLTGKEIIRMVSDLSTATLEARWQQSSNFSGNYYISNLAFSTQPTLFLLFQRQGRLKSDKQDLKYLYPIFSASRSPQNMSQNVEQIKTECTTEGGRES